MRRGELWWAVSACSVGSAPGYRGTVVVIRADAFTDSSIATVIVVATTTNFDDGLRMALAL